MATLDALDAELAALLKRRQNGYFSDADQIRLQELIDTREAIEVKYRLSPADADGFDTIRQKLEAEVARAQARGKQDADVTVYRERRRCRGAGAGRHERGDRRAVRQGVRAHPARWRTAPSGRTPWRRSTRSTDENRRNAALEYAALLSDVVPKVWAQADIQQAASDVDTLTRKLREYSAAGEAEKPALLEDLSAIAAAMDEGAMTEYLADAHADPVPFGQRPVGKRDSGHVPGDRLHDGAGADRRHPDVPETAARWSCRALRRCSATRCPKRC